MLVPGTTRPYRLKSLCRLVFCNVFISVWMEDRLMADFIIHTHGRLQEWVAEEKGYFAAEGLTDYALSRHGLLSPDHVRAPTLPSLPDNRNGAYQTYEQGRNASVSCACHWTVNKAAGADLGRLWGECYTVTPCGIFVPNG